jgi:hypothetical protein
MLRTALRRVSWKMIEASPAASRARSHAPRMSSRCPTWRGLSKTHGESVRRSSFSRCNPTRNSGVSTVTKAGQHRVDNGILLRSDVHTLFDQGYLTVTPDHSVRVSRRLKTDFDNGEHYYQLDGSRLWMPDRVEDRPNREFLQWHADTAFRG